MIFQVSEAGPAFNEQSLTDESSAQTRDETHSTKSGIYPYRNTLWVVHFIIWYPKTLPTVPYESVTRLCVTLLIRTFLPRISC